MDSLAIPFVTEKLSAAAMPVRPTSAPAAILDGKIPGLSIVRVSGAPGADVLVQLRNQRDLDGRTQPLYIVDGVLLTAFTPITSQDIEALDIEQVEVLKGAVAAALYGGRAAGGVVVISTRRGEGLKMGTTQFSLRNEAGQDYNTGRFDKTHAHFYRVNAAGEYVNAAGVPVSRSARQFQPIQIQETPYVVPLYNHTAEFFEPGGVNNQTIALSQRRATNNFNVSYTRSQQRGTVPNAAGYLRQSARVNANQRIGSKMSLAGSLSATQGNEDPSAADFFGFALAEADQSLRAKPTAGTFPYTYALTTLFGGAINPLAQQILVDRRIVRKRLLASASASYRPVSWLSFDVSGSYDRFVRQDTANDREINTAGVIQPGTISYGHDSTYLGWLQGGIRLSRTFGALSSQLAARTETQHEFDRESAGISRVLTIPGAPPGTPPPGSSSQSSIDRHFRAEVASLNLDYNGKYVVDGVYRQEHLRPTFGKHPMRQSARGAVAWMLNRESWLPFQSMSLFKLRYGRGKIERAPIDNGTNFLAESEIYNAPLEIFWENEFGTDISVSDRLAAAFTYTTSQNNSILQPQRTLGVPFYYPVRLKGSSIEGSIQARMLSRANGLEWKTTLVFGHRESKVDKFGRPGFYWFDEANVLTSIADGMSPTVIWGQRLVRTAAQLNAMHPGSQSMFTTDDLGNIVPVGAGNSYRDGKTKNLWGTSVTVDGVRYPWGLPFAEKGDNPVGSKLVELGDMNPDLEFGWQNQFRYRGLRMHTQFAGQLGGVMLDEAKRLMYAVGAHADVDQSQKPIELRKPRQYYQAVSQGGVQDAFIQNAQHLRLAEASVGYTFNAATSSLIKRIGAERIEVDLIGRNLFTTAKTAKGDVLGNALYQRVQTFQYPRTRTFTLATSLTF